MHIVYLIEFTNRKNNYQMPFYYIGSKSDCNFINGKIIGKNNKPYYGSSRDTLYKELIKNDDCVKISILYSSNDYKSVLSMENLIQKSNDVVANPKYFNKSFAQENTFHNPNYGTYRHSITGKCVRLDKDHPRVLSKEYVNVNFGYKTYNNGIIEKQFLNIPSSEWIKGRLPRNILRGKDSSFYGKKLSKNSIQKGLENRKINFENDPEHYKEVIRNRSRLAKEIFSGVPKSEDHKKKIGLKSKNHIVLKNINSGKTIKIHKDDKINYDENIWINTYKYKVLKEEKIPINCPHCKKESYHTNSTFKRWHFDNCKFKENNNENNIS